MKWHRRFPIKPLYIAQFHRLISWLVSKTKRDQWLGDIQTKKYIRFQVWKNNKGSHPAIISMFYDLYQSSCSVIHKVKIDFRTYMLQMIQRSHWFAQYLNIPCVIIGHNIILTLWGRVTHASVQHTNIASDNCFAPVRHRPIIWTHADILSIRSQGIYFSSNSFETQKFYPRKCSSKRRLRNGHRFVLASFCWYHLCNIQLWSHPLIRTRGIATCDFHSFIKFKIQDMAFRFRRFHLS